jgi:hypothetical protein
MVTAQPDPFVDWDHPDCSALDGRRASGAVRLMGSRTELILLLVV